jgi:hypothetical protein
LLPQVIEGTRSAASQPRIEELSDRMIIGGVTVFKSDAESVPEEHEMPTSGRDALGDILNSPDFRSMVAGLVEHQQEAHEQLADLDFAALSTAIDSLLPEIERFLEQHGTEGLAQAAELDGVEFALLVQIDGALLSRRRSVASRDPLELTTLVEQLGLPAERVQSAMAGLLLKLLMVLARN